MTDFLKIFGGLSFDQTPNPENFSTHMHDNYEIFCFLSGNAEYIVEGSIYPLHKGDFLLMRYAEAHNIHLLSSSPYKRMVINFQPSQVPSAFMERLLSSFNNRPIGKMNHYPQSTFSNNQLIYYMEKLCFSNDLKIRSAYLNVLLLELSEHFQKLRQIPGTSKHNLCTDVISYINEHLTEELSLQQLSEHFFISESQLNRNFKSFLGSTVWDYITRKRLLIAKNQLEQGANPTKIYLDCGFNDYTTFYRAYRSRFGMAPSKTPPSAK